MRSLHLLPLAALALTLSACGGTSNRGLETVHQAVVTRTNYTFDVPDGQGGSSARDVRGWLESIKVGYGDRISVDDPSGNSSNRIAIAAIASRYGLIVEDTAPVTQGEVAPGMFRVVVSRSKAEVPGCPDWSRSSVGNYNSEMTSNYGCASSASMAAMVANPEDLVAPRHSNGVADTITSRNAIRKVKGAN